MEGNGEFSLKHDDFEVSAKDSRGISSGQLTCAVGHRRDVGPRMLIWEPGVSQAVIKVKELGEAIGKHV